MVRRWFFGISGCLFALVALVWLVWPPVLWSLLVLVPLFALGVRDSFQNQHTVLKNFPIIGHGRYMVEGVRPELQQYLIESNLDAYPVEREFRSLVYQRAKNELETRPFGTQRNVYRVGYEWASHSLAPVEELDEEPRVMFGGEDCTQPYSASHLNVSAMSFGSISSHAILALNGGAKKGGFAHNTGEGGVSRYHLEPGGDLIWQIGTGYFGCRTKDGGFDPERFRETAGRDSIRMIELKLSQGAKPGHGGILPAAKVTPEIAEARGLPEYEAALSPPWHSAFTTPVEMIEFVARLRELSDGKPVGIKLCVGRRTDFLAMCKAMIEIGTAPDFITVDGDEIRRGADFYHGLAHRQEIGASADAKLDADRLAVGQFSQTRDELDHLHRRGERRVPRRRQRGFVFRQAARLCNLGRHLGRRQNATVARLGALGQFQFDHPDRITARRLAEALRVEAAVFRPTAEIAGPDLPDQIATGFEVIPRHPALAGVVGEPALLRPAVQRQDGVAGNRAEAHRRDIEMRGRIRLRAIFAAEHHPRLLVQLLDRCQ